MPRHGSQDTEPTGLPRSPTFMGLPSRETHDGLDAVVLGVSDPTPVHPDSVGSAGAETAAGAIRVASASLRPYNPLLAVDVTERLAIGDLGDIDTRAGGGAAPRAPSDQRFAAEPGPLAGLVRAAVPWIALGGAGGLLLDELRALAPVHGPPAVVRFDAHHGLSPVGEGETGGASVLRAALEEGLVDVSRSLVVGQRGPLADPSELGLTTELGIEIVNFEELSAGGLGGFAQRAHARLGGSQVVVSLDLDFLDPAFAPGTVTPVVGGPSSREGLTYLRSLAGLDIRAFDCVGLCPGRDPDGTTALVAAAACFEMLSLLAVRHG